MSSNRERVAFRTFGCRLNQYDTESIRTLLEAAGRYEAVTDEQERTDAEVHIVNTCSVTARADATARRAVRRIHAANPNAKIVVTGCYAQRAPEELAELPGVALVLGAADRGRVVEELEQIRAGDEARVAVSPVSEARKFLEVPITEMLERRRAFVKIQEGCNESCSFCIVPQTRGVSRSRDPDAVLEQARRLVDGGYPEIVLTGVHAGDYGLDLEGPGAGRRQLVELIERLLEVPGLARFRLSSIEPASVSPELISLMATAPKFAHHFHIPMQSGNDEVLARMRRRYTADDFRRLVHQIRNEVPDCGIGTDVICGFPGETDAAFQDTFDLLQSLPISYLHPFTYSPRPGSEAAGFPDDVTPEVKKRRVGALKRLSRDNNRAFRTAQLGKIESVLPENADGTGWTGNYVRVRIESAEGDAAGAEGVATAPFDGDNLPGLIPVRLEALTEDGVRGVVVKDSVAGASLASV